MSDNSIQEIRKIAKEAYIFGFPFVANYRVFIGPVVSGHPMMQGAGFNQFAHNRQPFPPTTPDTTQRDTIFSLGVLDLRREPVVISIPDVPDGQVYMLQMGDTSTESLPYISTLTTGNKAGDYVLVGPDFVAENSGWRWVPALMAVLGGLALVVGLRGRRIRDQYLAEVNGEKEAEAKTRVLGSN